jgi:hypothetical protein
LGGGGGGGARNSVGGTNPGGAGGKGVIILRTPDTVALATSFSGTITNPTGFYVYTFNDSGTIKWGL